MASETDIVNQGLILLGASTITNLGTGTSINAVKARAVYEDTRDELTSQYSWKFAIKRKQLTADATAPAFGKARRFKLPGDYLAPIGLDPEQDFMGRDWVREGNFLLTDDTSPLDFRYIFKVEDPDAMDVLYRKTLSAVLAIELCEQITQSTTKLQQVAEIFKNRIKNARKKNAFEAAPRVPARDEWITARDRGRDNTRRWL